MVKVKKKRKIKAKDETSNEPIIIDKKAGLVFNSEKELLEHFRPQIELFEKEFRGHRDPRDFSDKDLEEFDDELDLTVDKPDQIWADKDSVPGTTIFHFHRSFESEGVEYFYVVVCLLDSDDVPAFVFLHFATKFRGLLEKFQRGELVYDKVYDEFEPAGIEGDALMEGDSLALGLFAAMMKIRSGQDIPLEKFQDYAELREETVSSPDEIWKSNDMMGNNLVTFIREFPDHPTGDLSYVVVTHEDEGANVHSLLFSFPSNDESLLDRYRHGENLQAEEVQQESSH